MLAIHLVIAAACIVYLAFVLVLVVSDVTQPNVYIQVMIALLLLFQRHYGVRSSGVNFIFWTGMVIYGIFKLRSYILISMDEGQQVIPLSHEHYVGIVVLFLLTRHTCTCTILESLFIVATCTFMPNRTVYVHVTLSQVDVFRLTTFCVQLLVYLVEFVLSFFPEPKPRRRLYQLGLDDEVGTTVL